MAKVIKSIIPALIIFCVFLYGLIPINDFDFWWHLKTGEYILETRQLPDVDPFSYTAVSTDTDSPGRPQFILKSYWLGQVVFALVVKYLGLKGFIVMRAILFALISLTVLKIQGLQSAVSGPKSGVPELRTGGALHSQAGCALLFLLAMLTTESLTDRPQMFSFLFAIFLVFLFERYRLRASRAALYAIPLLMLLWAQIHAGYIVGIAYLLVYLMATPFEEGLKEKRKILIPLIALSVLITYLNPCHWKGIGEAFYAHGGSILFRETLEFLSPVTIMPFVKKNPGWLSYWALVGFSFIAAVGFLKKRSWSRLLIILGTAIASLISMRYTYFFAPVAAALLPYALTFFQAGNREPELRARALKDAAALVVSLLILVSAVVFTFHKLNFRGLMKSDTAYGFFPEQASDYVLLRGIPQPMMNDINWGGFLIYRLWPGYKVFVDTRTLNIDIYRQYMNVLNYTRQGRDILKVYGIKSIITPALNPYTGEIFSLARGLMNDDDWALIYLDGTAMIFVKKEYAVLTLPKAAVYEEVFSEAMFWAPSFPNVPGYQRTMEEVKRALAGSTGPVLKY